VVGLLRGCEVGLGTWDLLSLAHCIENRDCKGAANRSSPPDLLFPSTLFSDGHDHDRACNGGHDRS